MNKTEKIFHNKTFIVKDNIYNFDLIIIIGDEEFYHKHLKNKYKLDMGKQQKNKGGESFVMKYNDKIGSVVWMPRLNFTSVNYGILGHELLHIALNVMQKIGFKFNYNNTEPLNYYFEYLMTETLWKLVKHMKPKSKT